MGKSKPHFKLWPGRQLPVPVGRGVPVGGEVGPHGRHRLPHCPVLLGGDGALQGVEGVGEIVPVDHAEVLPGKKSLAHTPARLVNHLVQERR